MKDRNEQPENNKSHPDVLCERLISQTIDGDLNWQPYYGEVRVGPGADSLQNATQPKGYILSDKNTPFGLTTVQVHDEMAEVRQFNPRLFNSGERQKASETNIHTLVQAIEVYLEEIQRGDRESPQDKASRRVQQMKQQFQHQVDRMETKIQQKEARIGKLISTIGDIGKYADPKPQPPKLTVEELKAISRKLYDEAHPETGEDEFQQWFDEERAAQLLYRNYQE